MYWRRAAAPYADGCEHICLRSHLISLLPEVRHFGISPEIYKEFCVRHNGTLASACLTRPPTVSQN
jgi:hypothetical protein